MLSEDKITVFLKLQQAVLDLEEGTKLLQLFLPTVLEELASLGYCYEFLSAIFVDPDHKLQRGFFVDKQTKIVSEKEVIHTEILLERGSSWEMELLYGRPLLISDIKELVDLSFPKFSEIRSLLILPIQNTHNFSGILVLASPASSDKINPEEIEFMQMITRLIDLGYRLQDTESSLTQITQQVYEMNAKLHQLDKLKDEFVSVASHELRTPMTAIRSYVWMALHKSDIPLSQKLERYLYRTLISTERLINLVNDMLNVSRIESGHIEINPKVFDIVALVKDVMEEVKVKAMEKRLSLLVLEHKIPQVFADPDKVHEVLLNLLGNSLKFDYPGGMITVDFFTDGKMVEVSVRDNGLGIVKEDVGKLFKKFGRLDNSYVSISTSGGTGLGLYISKSLVEMMHGSIWAQSEGVDKGSTFTFSLPIATQEVLKESEEFHVRPKGEAKTLEPVAI
ncbi:MAG: Sensor protein [Microgenomates group bacterium Gr01-1014_7]|nr:MAG: Sensor protein [Microgenomates group bacterium Gr01-1014_7]